MINSIQLFHYSSPFTLHSCYLEYIDNYKSLSADLIPLIHLSKVIKLLALHQILIDFFWSPEQINAGSSTAVKNIFPSVDLNEES